MGQIEVPETEKAFMAQQLVRLGADLYRELAKTPGNFAFSPLGIASELELTAAGVSSRSVETISRILGWKAGSDHSRAACAGLLVGARHGGFWHSLGVFGRKAFLAAYVAKIEQRLGAEARVAPGDQLGSAVLAWLDDTHNTELSWPRLKSPSGLVVAEVASVSGAWRQPFTLGRTISASFGAAGQAVSMMRQTVTVPVTRAREGTLFELAYRDPTLALDIFLPRDGLGVSELKLTAEGFRRLLSDSRPETLELSLPKFSLRSGLELGHALQSLGAGQLLGSRTPLAGMSDQQEFHLGLLLHRADFSVEESGSRGAANSGQPPGTAAGLPAFLEVNQPFIFMVREVLTGTPLLMGRVVDPLSN